MAWWKKRPRGLQAGSALFRGRWVSRPEDFAGLAGHGVAVGAPTRLPEGGWTAPLEHPTWGQATLVALPDVPLPPGLLVAHDPRLTEEEKAAVRACGWSVAVTAEPRTGNVLEDRKDLLRFLHAALGHEGVAAVDHGAQAFWSREGLDAELAHGAELDIDAVHTLHVVTPDEPGPGGAEVRPGWLHSHGLQGLGAWDFDVLDPDPGLLAHAHDLTRALAFAAVEGRLDADGQAFPLVAGEAVRGVPARAFRDQAAPAAHPGWRADVDAEHLEGHLVVCEPTARGWLGWLAGGRLDRLTGGDRPRASRFLQGPLPEEVLIQFSDSATDLMARRARQMLPLFREVATELIRLDLPALVKLGYPVDGGDLHDREHLWFQVHAFDGDAVEATLLNQPYRVARLRAEERGRHPLELLSDWAIFTPVGQVNPRETRALRFLQRHRDRLAEVLAEARRVGEAGGRG
jgi:uncharacterized protein YegJ (DUF2314 family)